MIQIVDVNPVLKGNVTIYADTKDEVPGTLDELKAVLAPNKTAALAGDIAAGSLIYTSALEVAFVRSEGVIQWKDDESAWSDAELDDGVLTINEAQNAEQDGEELSIE